MSCAKERRTTNIVCCVLEEGYMANPNNRRWPSLGSTAEARDAHVMALCRVLWEGTQQSLMAVVGRRSAVRPTHVALTCSGFVVCLIHGIRRIGRFAVCRSRAHGKVALLPRVYYLPSAFFVVHDKEPLCRVPDIMHMTNMWAHGKIPFSGSGSWSAR